VGVGGGIMRVDDTHVW